MQTMYPGMVNSPITELASAIDDTQTTIEVVDGNALPDAPNLATIGQSELAETVLYTIKTGNTLSGVTRGFQATARSWGAGQKIARMYTAYDHDAFINHADSKNNPHNVSSEQVNKITAKLVDDLPAVYPIGISLFNLTSSLADPWKLAIGHVGSMDSAMVETSKDNGDYLIIQRVTFHTRNVTPEVSGVYERSSTANNNWNAPWVKVVSRSEFDSVTAQLADTGQVVTDILTSGFIGTYKPLPTFSDYNDLITPGVYHGVYSTAKINEPITTPGARRVTIQVDVFSDLIVQQLTYVDFGSASNSVFTRTKQSTWKVWSGLSKFEEGIFTPELRFGGSGTGIVYAEQFGRYRRVGNLVHFEIQLLLSSRGTSTGDSSIQGLPFIAASNPSRAFLISEFRNLSLPPNAFSLAGILSSNSLSLRCSEVGAASNLGLDHTFFTNTTRLFVSGSYQI